GGVGARGERAVRGRGHACAQRVGAGLDEAAGHGKGQQCIDAQVSEHRSLSGRDGMDWTGVRQTAGKVTHCIGDANQNMVWLFRTCAWMVRIATSISRESTV